MVPRLHSSALGFSRCWGAAQASRAGRAGAIPPRDSSPLRPPGMLTIGKCVSHQARGISEGYASFCNVAACTQQDEGWKTVLRWERGQEKGSSGLPTALKGVGPLPPRQAPLLAKPTRLPPLWCTSTEGMQTNKLTAVRMQEETQAAGNGLRAPDSRLCHVKSGRGKSR